MSCIEFTVNGKKCTVDRTLSQNTTLNAYIRYVLALPGTKAMCHEGGCGSCIVTVRARRYPSGQIETFSVNSCLVLVFSCNGWEVLTIEHLGSRLEGYSDEQKTFASLAATQCGYCTPGWIMQLHSLRHKNLTMAEMEKSFGSNTCRCTGYRPIMDAVKSFAIDASPDLRQHIKDIEDLKICSKTNTVCEKKCSSDDDDDDWTMIENVDDGIISLNNRNYKFFKVFNEADIFEVLKREGVDSYMLVDGNTGKGILENYEYPRVLIDISEVKSLKRYYIDQNLVLGANISIQDCMEIFTNIAENTDEFAYLSELVKHLDLVAHIPVRKIGSLAGNLMMKRAVPTYQSDVFVLFECIGACITVRDAADRRTSLTMTQFLKYDMTGMLMINIALPPLSASHIFRSYKIMPRHQNSLAIVNAAFLIKLNSKNNIIDEATIVYGNISTDFVHAKKTEAYLKKKNIFTNTSLQGAIKLLNLEIVPKDNPPEPSPECRKKLAIGLFYKFILNICPSGIPRPSFRTGGSLLTRPVSKGVQDYQTDPKLYPLNEPVQKLEAIIQSSGEARYANDLPPTKKEVYGAFVLSTIHAGDVDKVNTTDVLKINGVLAVFTSQDIPGKNSFTFPGIQLQTVDEEILATTVKFYGQPVAIVVATSEELAEKVAKKVKVTYKNVSNAAPVLTIDDAKKISSRYFVGDATIEPKGKGTNVMKVIKGTYEIEAQYHYYLEPITCVVVPVDKGLEVYDSTQWMDLTQIAVARCLGIKESDVIVKVRRVGGGFGGKISRNVQVATACAIVAKKMNQTCRFILPVETNLTIAGRRLPCQCDYEVGVDNDGKIQYLNATIIQDKGCTTNESILSYTSEGFPNCYNRDYFSVKTADVVTDLPSNTFARAPGTSEGIACIEHIMEHIAFTVQKDATEVRVVNMRTDDNDLPKLIKTLKKEADYDKRVKDIKQFNASNRWNKRAIQISVMSFPVVYYGNYSAMVSIYRGDGTVTVTTGGIEMGQGCNTKVAQVCAYKLGIPLDYITVIPHFSFTAANNVFSGSSITTESVSYSTIKACDEINARLQPIKDEMPQASWKDIIKTAGDRQVDLTAIYMMTDTDKNLSGYSAFAVAILEVALDVLTGRFELLRVDILEDCGISANPKIDVGQVEGAYIQGVGYFTSEKFVYNKTTGRLLTNRSLTYHVPLALDIPTDFRIKLRYNYKNPKGVLGSKTCGEMGICTAHGVTHALRQCITESRKDSGYNTKQWQNISVPYDTESILKALDVKLEEFLIT